MKILINLSTIKKGGGQNVALNFLNELFNNGYHQHQFLFLAVEGSETHKFILSHCPGPIFTSPENALIRTWHEYFSISKIIREQDIDIIYTYFGYGLFKTKVPQVCGVAVSNIFFPEIKFWEGSPLKLLMHKIVDRYRLYGIKKADALFFENQAMEARAHDIYKISKGKTTFIAPSFNPTFEQQNLETSGFKKNATKLLMLCGWQRNKNIMRVPEIAARLKKSKHVFLFVITAPNDHSKDHLRFLSLAKKYEVEDMIAIIGPIKKQYLKSLYDQIDFVVLLSKLESFSNNIIEAWHFKKPLVISDEEWSKAICRQAALYVDRESPQKLADSITMLKESIALQEKLVESGDEILKDHPTIEQKTIMELSFLEKIYSVYNNPNK